METDIASTVSICVFVMMSEEQNAQFSPRFLFSESSCYRFCQLAFVVEYWPIVDGCMHHNYSKLSHHLFYLVPFSYCCSTTFPTHPVTMLAQNDTFLTKILQSHLLSDLPG